MGASRSKRWRLAAGRATLAAAMLCLSGLAVTAQQPAGSPDAISPERLERQSEFERVAAEITVSEERIATLKAEVDALKADAAAITSAMVQAAKTEKKLASEIADIELRLDGLNVEADAVRLSLAARRDVLAEVLGALQRMGLNPPPALLVTPEDALSSVRSAILLGAVVPEMRAETVALAAEMAELRRIAGSIEAERDRLTETVTAQAEEKARLDLLQQEKDSLRTASERSLVEEQTRVAELAGRATTLRQLIETLEVEERRQAEAAEAARRAEAEAAEREARAVREAVPEANRLAAAVPFAELAGRLPLPVAGRFSRRFGGADGTGGAMQGDTVTTQSGAIVTAPSDAIVLYAGPFRSYGQLLILNAGDGYHIVLAGMGRISVGPGQSVVAGEPIAAMGETRLASIATLADGNTAPELYVEFRKDGKPVDPTRWWAERLSGRTADGT